MRAATGPRTRSAGSARTASVSRAGHHLRVADRPELAAQPAELGAQGLAARTVPAAAEGAQRGPQPADGDPRVVHRVLVTVPGPGMVRDQHVALGEGVAGDRVRRSRVGGGGEPAGEGPMGLGDGNRAGARLAQPRLHRVEQPVVAVDQLDLDLPPRLPLAGDQVPPVDGVLGDLGQHPARSVQQPSFHPVGGDPGRRLDRLPAGGGPEQPDQLRRRVEVVRAGRELVLGPGAPGRADLQVPAGVVTAGPPAQREAAAPQPQVRGVHVDRVQVEGGGVRHRRDATAPRQVRQPEALVGGVLAFPLHHRRHADPIPARTTGEPGIS
ncbi:hypothetical protein M2302_002167 [Micromonospora sp. A200]|nr:hypothetical protein [Micromonospora sp. A200]